MLQGVCVRSKDIAISMKANSSRLRGISDRALLITMSIIAPLTWGGLLLFTRYVPPQSPLAFLVAFLLVGTALLCTLSPVIYLVTRRVLNVRPYRPTVRSALRQGGLISSWVVFNLVLRVLHSWSVFTAIVSFGIIVVGEILVLGRK